MYYAVLHLRFITPVLYRFILKVIFLNFILRACSSHGHTFCVLFLCYVVSLSRSLPDVNYYRFISEKWFFVRAVIAPKSWDIPILAYSVPFAVLYFNVIEVFNWIKQILLHFRKEVSLLELLSRGTNLSMQEAGAITPLLSLLSSLLSNALFSVHDNEFYGEDGKMAVIILFVCFFLGRDVL